MDKLVYERELINKGCVYICGVDEVGRGPLAGPVVCAAVIMPLDDVIEGVDDSKKLSAKKRETLSAEIIEKAVAYAICRVEPEIIDEINILQATRLCMKNAVESLAVKPDFVLTDGNMKLDIELPQKSIVQNAEISAVFLPWDTRLTGSISDPWYSIQKAYDHSEMSCLNFEKFIYLRPPPGAQGALYRVAK